MEKELEAYKADRAKAIKDIEAELAEKLAVSGQLYL